MDNILEYENLIYKMISPYKSFDKEDLYQVAMMGLMKAGKNYKKDENTKFSTYAYYYIQGEINSYITASSPIKVSKELIRLNRSLENAKEVMRQHLKREPTTLELSLFLDVSEEKIEEAIIATSQIESLDYAYSEEEKELYDSLGTTEQAMDENILDLRNAISELPREEQQLIIARYYDDMTQQETSATLGMTQVQVSRKENKILEKLKTAL